MVRHVVVSRVISGQWWCVWPVKRSACRATNCGVTEDKTALVGLVLRPAPLPRTASPELPQTRPRPGLDCPLLLGMGRFSGRPRYRPRFFPVGDPTQNAASSTPVHHPFECQNKHCWTAALATLESLRSRHTRHVRGNLSVWRLFRDGTRTDKICRPEGYQDNLLDPLIIVHNVTSSKPLRQRRSLVSAGNFTTESQNCYFTSRVQLPSAMLD